MSQVFKNLSVAKEEKYINSDLEYRLLSVQCVLKRLGIDGLLIINGSNGLRNVENTKFTNYLFKGYSSHSIFRDPDFDMDYEESMIMITPTNLSLFIEHRAFNQIRSVILSLHNPNIFLPQGDISDNQDLLENLKIREFYRMVYDKPVIGVLLPPSDLSTTKAVEQWPIVKAYGLDGRIWVSRYRWRFLHIEA